MLGNSFAKLLKDPLLHFLIIGMGVFITLDWLRPDTRSENARVLTIDKTALIGFMQYRDQKFDQKLYAQKLASLSAAEHNRLVNEFTEQEVLHREALRLGLDQGDAVIKRRTIQRMKYMLENFIPQHEPLSEDQIRDYFEAHKNDYRQPAKISFTHLYYSADDRNSGVTGKDRWTVAETRSQHALQQLKQGQTPDSDYFPYHRNYADKSKDQIARHFGKEFAEQLIASIVTMPVSDTSQWREGFRSAYGYHLISIKKYTPAVTPEFEAIFSKLETDANQAAYKESQRVAVLSLIEQYEIKIVQ